MTATTTPNVMGDMFKTMTDAYTKSFQTGVKFFEDASRSWTDTMNRTTDEYRTRAEKMVEDFSQTNKKNLDRVARFFEEQTQRTGTFIKNVGEMQPAATPAEIMDRMGTLGRQSFEMMRDGADAAARMTGDLMASATTCCRANEVCGETPAAKKAAK